MRCDERMTTREEAIKNLNEHKTEFTCDFGWNTSVIKSLDMAIKALEQEPCEDAISRQAVLSLVSDGREGLGNIIYASDVEQLPSVSTEKTRHWIPVSERLPEFHQGVLLSLRSLDVRTGFRAKVEPYFYCHGMDGCYIEPQNVLAWMPLPEPYKEGVEE